MLLKRKAIALTLVLGMLFFSSASMVLVDVAEGNWMIMPRSSPPAQPEVTVILPETNITYGTMVSIDLRVVGFDWADLSSYIELPSITYSLDDRPFLRFVGEQNVSSYDLKNLTFFVSGNITGLTQGDHSIVFNAECKGRYSPDIYKMVDFTTNASSPKTSFRVDANITDKESPKISILSPKQGVYNSSDIAVTFAASDTYNQVKYILNGQKEETINGKTTLTGLLDGANNLALVATNVAGYSQTSAVCFTVSGLPIITIISPQRTTYYTPNVTLTYRVNEPTSWVKYTLDARNPQDLSRNSINNSNLLHKWNLTYLEYGQHNISLSASDINGNIGYSLTIEFTVSEKEPSPTVPIAAVSAAVLAVVAVAGLLVYHKKHKR
jgi:hypothetical protein